jgi:hypothetical protein
VDARETRGWGGADHKRFIARLISRRELPKSNDKQTRRSAAFEMVDALQLLCVGQCLGGLQIDQNQDLDQQVHQILAGHDTVTCDDGALLLRSREAHVARFVDRRIAMDLFQKSGPERIQHSERAADDDAR